MSGSTLIAMPTELENVQSVRSWNYESLPSADDKTYTVATTTILNRPQEATRGKLESRKATTDEEFSKAIEDLAAKDPEIQSMLDTLRTFIGQRVSTVDILRIFFECLKLILKNRDNDKLGRREERRLFVAHKEKEIATVKQQAQWQLFSGVGSGVLSFGSAAIPIVGFVKGGDILGGLSKIFSSLKGLETKKDEVFRNVAKMVHASAEIQKTTGQLQNTKAETHLVRFRYFSDLNNMDIREISEELSAMLEQWRAIENFLNHYLQTEHEATRSLYS